MSTFFITGCNRGIGLGLSREILKQGHNLIGACRNPNGARDLWELETDYPDRVQLIGLDVTDEDQIAESLATLPPQTSIDVLINNAGVGLEFQEDLLAVNAAKLEHLYRVNSIGPLLVFRQCLPLLRRVKSAKLFNISSQMASITNTSKGTAYGYRASKAALNMWTKCLAMSFPEIGVFALDPGWVQTDMGGPNATLSIEESTVKLFQVMMEKGLNDTGRFFNYLGEECPW